VIKLLWFCILLPVNIAILTTLVLYYWVIDIFNMPFELWDELE
jgi:hypothetical protein